jgi:hypothetical protein
MPRKRLRVILGMAVWLVGIPAWTPGLQAEESALAKAACGARSPELRCVLKDDDCPHERWASGGKTCVCAPAGICDPLAP